MDVGIFLEILAVNQHNIETSDYLTPKAVSVMNIIPKLLEDSNENLRTRALTEKALTHRFPKEEKLFILNLVEALHAFYDDQISEYKGIPTCARCFILGWLLKLFKYWVMDQHHDGRFSIKTMMNKAMETYKLGIRYQQASKYITIYEDLLPCIEEACVLRISLNNIFKEKENIITACTLVKRYKEVKNMNQHQYQKTPVKKEIQFGGDVEIPPLEPPDQDMNQLAERFKHV